jgi:hypothetical protein
MPENSHDPREELKRLLAALVESSVETSGQEVAALLRANGRDPDVIAERLRARMLATAKEYLQLRLRKAREEYEGRASVLEGVRAVVGGSLAEWRARLGTLLAGNPEARLLVTLQYRDYKNLSDDDLASLILQLKDLGLLEDSKPPSNEKK